MRGQWPGVGVGGGVGGQGSAWPAVRAEPWGDNTRFGWVPQVSENVGESIEGSNVLYLISLPKQSTKKPRGKSSCQLKIWAPMNGSLKKMFPFVCE